MTTQNHGDSAGGVCDSMDNRLEGYLPWIILCEIVVFDYSDFELCFCGPTHSTLVLSRRRIVPSSTCLRSVVLTC